MVWMVWMAWTYSRLSAAVIGTSVPAAWTLMTVSFSVTPDATPGTMGKSTD